MSATQLSDSAANALAVSLGYPANALEADIPSYGVFVVNNNKRYLLAVSQTKGIYFASDISVYSNSGALLTDTTDVYLDATLEILSETGSDIGNYLIMFGKALPFIIGGFLLYKLTQR